MKIIEPSYEILSDIDGLKMLKHIETAGRVCYKTEDKISDESAKPFVNMICNTYKHHSVIEHCGVSVRFICNRGFSHEMVRHRIASYSQESTRYVNYSKDKSDNQVTFIKPAWFNDGSAELDAWKLAMSNTEESYLKMTKPIEQGGLGLSAQHSRGVLPIDVKTEIVVTCNLREWRTIFELRTSKQAHPSMQQLMRPLLKEFKSKIPVIFDGLEDFDS